MDLTISSATVTVNFDLGLATSSAAAETARSMQKHELIQQHHPMVHDLLDNLHFSLDTGCSTKENFRVLANLLVAAALVDSYLGLGTNIIYYSLCPFLLTV